MPATDDRRDSGYWLRRRVAYRLGLATLFASIAFYFGPNKILYDKLTRPTPADFVPVVEEWCVPIVGAMKAYERDHGRRPDRREDLVPDYLATEDVRAAAIYNGEFQHWGAYHHRIEYRFAPGDEGWYVEGPHANGRVPLPPVPAAATTATRPATHPQGNR